MHELAEVEVGLGRVLDGPIDAPDDRHRCVELTESAHRPVLALLLVVPADAGRFEELRGDPLLALAMCAFVAGVTADLAVGRTGGQHPLRVALPDAVEDVAGHDVHVPRLGVHRRRTLCRDLDDLVEHLPGHRFRPVPADAPAFVHQLLEFHGDPFWVRVSGPARPRSRSVGAATARSRWSPGRRRRWDRRDQHRADPPRPNDRSIGRSTPWRERQPVFTASTMTRASWLGASSWKK